MLVFHKNSPFHICELSTVSVIWNNFLSMGDVYVFSVVISFDISQL